MDRWDKPPTRLDKLIFDFKSIHSVWITFFGGFLIYGYILLALFTNLEIQPDFVPPFDIKEIWFYVALGAFVLPYYILLRILPRYGWWHGRMFEEREQ